MFKATPKAHVIAEKIAGRLMPARNKAQERTPTQTNGSTRKTERAVINHISSQIIQKLDETWSQLRKMRPTSWTMANATQRQRNARTAHHQYPCLAGVRRGQPIARKRTAPTPIQNMTPIQPISRSKGLLNNG